AEAGLLVRPERLRLNAEHVFSHIRWSVEVYNAAYGFFLGAEEAAAAGGASVAREAPAAAGYAAPAGAGELPDGWRWIGPADMDTLAFPNVFVRILGDYFASRGQRPNED